MPKSFACDVFMRMGLSYAACVQLEAVLDEHVPGGLDSDELAQAIEHYLQDYLNTIHKRRRIPPVVFKSDMPLFQSMVGR